MSKTESKLDLIAKLLAKAESTTPEEAEALTEHAERLMIKYGIEQAKIDERRRQQGQASEQIIQTSITWRASYARELRLLGINVAFALDTVRPLQSQWRDTATLYLVGFESDVRQAETLIRSLEIQAMVALRAWWAEHKRDYDWADGHTRRRARWGFIRGFGEGAASRIRANRRQQVEEAGTGTDLVLASRRSRVDEHVAAHYGNRRGRALGEADAHGRVHGWRAGQNANTGERSVTPGRGLPSGVSA